MLRGDTPLVIECNPRVQGTMVASLATGNNLIWLALRDKLGFDKPLPIQRTWGTSRLVRHWGGTLTLGDEVIEF
jgi:carbamoyl-phosphate synthase large subunit